MKTLADLGFPRPDEELSDLMQRAKTWRSISVNDFVRLFLAALYHQGKLPAEMQDGLQARKPAAWSDPADGLREWADDITDKYLKQADFSFGDVDASLVDASQLACDFVALDAECTPLFLIPPIDRVSLALELGDILSALNIHVNLNA